MEPGRPFFLYRSSSGHCTRMPGSPFLSRYSPLKPVGKLSLLPLPEMVLDHLELEALPAQPRPFSRPDDVAGRGSRVACTTSGGTSAIVRSGSSAIRTIRSMRCSRCLIYHGRLLAAEVSLSHDGRFTAFAFDPATLIPADCTGRNENPRGRNRRPQPIPARSAKFSPRSRHRMPGSGKRRSIRRLRKP